MIYTEYRFVLSRPAGLLELGSGGYPAPLRRGEVVVLTDRYGLAPDGQPFPPVSYIVEQVVHAMEVLTPQVAGQPERRHPMPHSLAQPTVYVRLLDEAGHVVPVASGPIPGVLLAPV